MSTTLIGQPSLGPLWPLQSLFPIQGQGSPWHINNPFSHQMFTIGSPLPSCHDPNLEFVTKTRAYKGEGQEWSLGVTFNALESVRRCEGMNPHIPKWAPTLGVRVPMDFQIFKERLKGSKLIGLKNSLYHWKAFRI